MTATDPLTADLRDLDCYFAVDVAPNDPETTAWKRRARLHQARWRAAKDYLVGSQPYRGGDNATRVGSRLELDCAYETGANFITERVRAAVEYRLSYTERHQMLRKERLYADLLSSMPLCFNLFGDLWDSTQASSAVHNWWPDAPTGDVTLKFEHSPGRLDANYLNNRSAFDAAFYITRDDGTHALVGIETKYHEHARPEAIPGPHRLLRYIEVTERSNAFVPDWRDRIPGTNLQQIWLDHLLILSALQHPDLTKRPTWGRFVLVHPSANQSFARCAAEYATCLRDTTTYEARTIESLLDTPGALDPGTVAEFRRRYLL